MQNPVFINELRQSLFRRKPVQAVGLWAAATLFLMWLSPLAALMGRPLSFIPIFALPLIVPPFAAGSFAKEYEQRTWQDLYLTRLTNAQVVLGKFCACLLLVGIMILSMLPALGLMLLRAGLAWVYAPGFWMVTLTFKLFISACLYILLGMTCSRYSSNRRTALVWSYVAMFLYALLGTAVWLSIGTTAAMNDAIIQQANGTPVPQNDPLAPGFMQGIHLTFCAVVGFGTMFLMWVSLSEQRGYNNDHTGDSARAWQPVRHSTQ